MVENRGLRFPVFLYPENPGATGHFGVKSLLMKNGQEHLK